MCGFLSTEANGAFDAKSSVGIQDAIFGRHRAVLPHAGNCIGAIEFHVQNGWGACPDTGMSTMIGKMMIGVAAVAIVSVATTMSASAQQKKKITAAIPTQVCETLTVDTQNWGQQTVQLCGPPGGARGQAILKPHRTQSK